MNKKELTARVASKTGLTNATSANVIDAVFQTIQENLENNQSTVLKGFGSFTITNHAQRMGVNPSTKQLMTIPARRVGKFNASKTIIIK